jgi:DNA-binding transcriptional MerR regulator
LDKKYYSIGEVADEVKLKEHVLRFWEKEFIFLSPIKNNAGHRKYTSRDINLIRKIKYLVQIERFTIPGARQKLLEQKNKLFDDFNEEEFRKEIRNQNTQINQINQYRNNQEYSDIKESQNLQDILMKQKQHTAEINDKQMINKNPEFKGLSRKELIKELSEILKLI